MTDDPPPTNQMEISENERLIRLLESSRHEALALLREVDDYTVVYSESGWRVKELLGHVAAWEREILAALQAFHEGETYSLGDDYFLEAYNQQHAEQRRSYDPAQIRMDWAMVRRDLQFAVQEIAPERMAHRLRFPWGVEGTVSELIEQALEHEADHLADIRAALANRPTTP